MQFPPAPMQPMQSPMQQPMQSPMQTPYTPVGAMAPVAQEMQGYGRGNDSMLVHMTPGEVSGLQALAQQHGGSLTTNPQTGLPEAGFLESILPMLAGGLLTMTGIGAPLAAALVGGGTGLLTGDLKQGLMAGLGAFGGASLAGALGVGAAGAGASTAASTASAALPGAAANAALPATATTAAASAAPTAGMAANLASAAPGAAPGLAAIAPHMASGAAGASGLAGANAVMNPAMSAMASGAPGAMAQNAPVAQNLIGQAFGDKAGAFANRFAQEAAGSGAVTPTKTGLAAMGVGLPIMEAMQPKLPGMPEEEGFNYEGPYRPTDRKVRFRGPGDMSDTSEFSYFENTNPYPGFEPAPKGYAVGGPIQDTGPNTVPAAQFMPMSGTMGPIAGAEDRALHRPGSGYRPGMGAEHNWNFRPVSGPGMAPTQLGQSTTPVSGGKGLNALLAGLRNRSTARPPGPTRDFRYNPRMQSIDETQNLARGGVALADGAFVMDARSVSELGNGSSGAGQELLARHGGKPIRGPGDGVSDSIPARVGKGQPARVARDEVKFDPKAVKRVGGGDARRGAQKLYALMDKAQQARKVAGRGADTKLRKALA